jgi:hypothetical protein
LGITIKASQEAGVTAEGNELSAQFFDLKYRGGDPDTVSLDAFLNKAGLITIYLDERSLQSNSASGFVAPLAKL